MDWTGITNENDFYSGYFFAEGLQGAINERLKAWAEAEEKAKAEAGERGEKTWAHSIPIALRQAARGIQEALDELERLKGESRLEAERSLNAKLLSIFGLPAPKKGKAGEIVVETLYPNGEDAMPLPLLGGLYVEGDASRPVLWVLEASALGQSDDDDDPLNWKVAEAEFTDLKLPEKPKVVTDRMAEARWLDLLSKEVFTCDHPPRWVILAAAKEWILIDSTKWSARSALRFNWMEIVSRRSVDVMNGCAALLSAESMSSVDGQVLLDTIDEAAHKQAYGVSESLKKSLRDAIELLGNEAAPQLINSTVNGKKVLQKDLADILTIECLRYMYRILFLLFVESRKELQYAPIENPAYATAYSFESLRDLELVPLVTDEDRNGRYLNDSIAKLFTFFGSGTLRDEERIGEQNSTAAAFEISPLRGALFDASRTPHLNAVVFTNKTLQAVIRKMSLSETGQGKGRRRVRTGRISYAHLGINQLGAVYEALLSYRGFFAKTDLYEVKKADAKENEFDTGYFVTADELDDYDEKEKVFVENEMGEKELKVYRKGTFIYRLTGREREKSASYYTPEVLTECVVEYGLKEYFETVIDKLPNDKAKAEKILSLKICEPAMGSAAFLNEAINQLSVKYMEHAQKAKGERLSMTEYRHELQRVKMYMADNCVFGVDLNPVAVELGEVSLWLNALSDDKFVPWFGLQLHAGNSLIGCRRTVYKREALLGVKGTDAAPIDLGPKPLSEHQIWQFLVPNPGMSNYKDADVKAVYPEEMKSLADRRKAFLKRISEKNIALMENLSKKAELLWQSWAKKLADLRGKTSDPYSIYGREARQALKLSYEKKNDLVEKIRTGDGSLKSGEYMRLKMAMNYWCALWFWPIDKAESFPTLDEFLADMGMLLSSEILNTASNSGDIAVDLFTSLTPAVQAEEDQSGRLNVSELELMCPNIAITEAVAKRYRFFHWPLVFADIFMPKSPAKAGFDLTFGNPPWRVPTWNSGAVIGDFIPSVLFRGESASKIRQTLLKKDGDDKTLLDRRPEIGRAWRSEFEEATGSQLYLGAEGNYPEIQGSSINLFKLFLPLAWRNASKDGVQGFVHPLTNFTETKGLILRKESYQRLRFLFQFLNELSLFPIDHHTKYAVAIYGRRDENVHAKAIMNVFHPKVIAETFASTDDSLALGIMDDKGNWNLKGQKDRLISLDGEALNVIGKVFSDSLSYPVLPNIHSESLLKVLGKFARVKKRIRNLGSDAYCISRMWDETEARKDGTIAEYPNKATRSPDDMGGLILNGPHLSVGNPFFKTPLPVCRHNLDWTCIDLEQILDDFVPRAKYEQNRSNVEYGRSQVICKWDGNIFDEQWRLFYRGMVPVDGERTLTGALYPPGVGCVNINNAIATKSVGDLLSLASSFPSIPLDAYVRQLGKMNLLPDLISNIPFVEYEIRKSAAFVRCLCLNCLTESYSDIWWNAFEASFPTQKWTQQHAGLNPLFFSELTQEWQRNCALRSDLSRRQALVELDVLTAQAMGLDLQDLLTLYKMRFRVLRSYEADTWYDQNGRIVFTPNSLGLAGVGLPRKKCASDAKDGITYRKGGYDVGPEGLGFEDIRDLKEGFVEKTYPDVSMTDTPVNRTVRYVAPFFKMDREKDYEIAWKVFEEKYGEVVLSDLPDEPEADAVEAEPEASASAEKPSSESAPKRRHGRAKKSAAAEAPQAAQEEEAPADPDADRQEAINF